MARTVIFSTVSRTFADGRDGARDPPLRLRFRAMPGGEQANGRAAQERPADLLYDVVTVGMWAYVRSAFRAEFVRPRGWQLRQGTLIVSTHRAETDVPVVVLGLYGSRDLWRHRHRPRMHWAARDDLFERGFFAGFLPGLGPRVRRALAPLSVGRFMSGLRVHPIGSAASLSLGRALAALPAGTELSPELLPPGAYESLTRRAAALGRRPPLTAGDVRSGKYADLLWQRYERGELPAGVFDAAWRRRVAEATGQLRALMDLMRGGVPLLLFPEGRPSPDGSIGPLRPGLGALVRRGAPAWIQPVGIAYDPLRKGRPRVVLAFGEPQPAPAKDVEDAVLRALRLATPLTCGALVASHLSRAAAGGRRTVGVAELEAAVDAAVAAARAEGRPVERALARPGRARRRRLAETLAALDALGALDGAAIDPARAAADPRVARSAREHASAREI